MQGNDIAPFMDARQATMFEGVLATPPVGVKNKFKEILARNDWSEIIPLWSSGVASVKSLADSVNRLGIATDVYTFLSPEAVDPIGKWLIRKGISVPVYFYENAAELAFDLTFNRAVRVVYTSNRDDAAVLGIRSTVVSPETVWSV